ncbi:MAG: YkgJ family cysteine cluster protein [Verrucomicrobia bacterium]|nr:YkgJ family cysteine cluster protein [Verrucomicrobiota bacterium]
MAGICDTCHAGCCRTYNLIVTVYDALVISRDLGLPIAEFVTFLATRGEQIKLAGGKNTPIIFSDPGYEEVRFFVTLKRVDSRLIAGTLKCYFLQEWNRQEVVAARGDHPGARIAGRCGIYGSRPLMCQTYPTVLHNEGAVGFIGTPPPTDLQKVHEIYKICPEKWSPEAFVQDPAKALHSLVLYNYETNFQNRCLAEWNASPGLMKGFFPFMLRAYGERFRLNLDMVASTPEVKKDDNPAPIPE